MPKPKPRPKKRRRPKHLVALEQDYEHYIEINGGEFCGICLKKRQPERRLDRDHEHGGRGQPRGLLCRGCNIRLAYWMTPEWLEAAAKYLRERSKPGFDPI